MRFLTKQQIFDKVSVALLMQGKKSVNAVNDACMYRGDGGTKCAAGHLIDDRNYHRDIENATVHAHSVLLALKCSGVSRKHLTLVSGLQNIHDNYDVAEWKARLFAVAFVYDLDTSKIEHIL